MRIITVSNGSNEYPGNFTPKEIKYIKLWCFGRVLHLFSGKSNIGHTRVDYKFGNIKEDVFIFLQNNHNYFDTVIIDAPYNKRFADKYQELSNTPSQFIIFANTKKTTLLFKYLLEMKPEYIILKSWNYYCLKGYHIQHSLLCYPGGYRKSTILLLMERNEL